MLRRFSSNGSRLLPAVRHFDIPGNQRIRRFLLPQRNFRNFCNVPPPASSSIKSSSTESSAGFLHNVFEKAVSSNKDEGLHEKKHGQVSQDEKLLKHFRHLSKEADLDRAILFCNMLPARQIHRGFDMLVNILLDKVNDYGSGISCQSLQSGKILKVVESMAAKGCIPSEVTNKRLLKWLSCIRDVNFFSKILKLRGRNAQMGELDMLEKSVLDGDNVPGRSLSVLCEESLGADTPNCQTNLIFIFQCLGRMGHKTLAEMYLRQLQLKGETEGLLLDLLDSFAKGITQACPEARDIKGDVEGFKDIVDSFKMGRPSSFNMLIGYCGIHGEVDLCICLIQMMKKYGLELSADTYEPLIILFSRTLEVSKAEDILCAMESHGMNATMKSYENLLIAYTKTGNMEKAYNLLEGVPWEKLNADLYTPLIHAYGMKGQLAQSLTVFKQMKSKGISPTADNFASLILAFSYRRDLKNAELVYSLFQKQNSFSPDDCKKVTAAMIRGYGICGQNCQVEKMIAATDSELVGESDVQSAKLSGYAKNGELLAAMTTFKNIRQQGIWPGSGSFLAFLSALGNAGKLNDLLDAFESFKMSVTNRNRVNQEELMSIACCHVINALVHHNDLERAAEFLQHVQHGNIGDVNTLCLKIFTNHHGKLFPAEGVSLTLEDKLKFVATMREKLKIKPTRIAYESLLESCAREKYTSGTDSIIQMMRSDNLHPNIFTFLILLRTVVTSGDEEDIKTFLFEMRSRVGNYGLLDEHVKLIVVQALRNLTLPNKTLINILYPQSRKKQISSCSN